MEKFLNRAPVIIFFAVISAPLAAMVLGLGGPSADLTENRQPAQLPSLTWSLESVSRFPRQFEDYFADNFGLRSAMVLAHNWIAFGVIDPSSSAQVIAGKDGWLFYAAEKALENHRRIFPFDSRSLRNWSIGIIGRYEWLKSRGIKYILVFVPEKSTVYPEMIPDKYSVCYGKTRLDQIMDRLRDHPEITVVDIRDDMARAKHSRGPVYHKTDTHWNARGAAVAYSAIMREYSSCFGIDPVPVSAFATRIRVVEDGGDLARMLGTGRKFHDEWLELAPTGKQRYRRSELESRWWNYSDWRKPYSTEIADKGLPRALMFGDSFARRELNTMISDNFSRVSFMHSGFNRRLVEAEKPDLVIEEMVERLLGTPGPADDDLSFYAPGRIIHEIEPGRSVYQIEALNQCRIRQLPHELEIEALGKEPQLLIADGLSLNEDAHYALRLVLETPNRTIARFLFGRTHRSNPRYDAADSVRVSLSRGLNEVSLSLPDPESIKNIRLDPGAHPGTYSIRAFQIKALYDSAEAQTHPNK